MDLATRDPKILIYTIFFAYESTGQLHNQQVKETHIVVHMWVGSWVVTVGYVFFRNINSSPPAV